MRPTAYLRNVGAQLSTVHRGLAFEQKSLQTLQDQMSMSLRRVGGKSDGGVDLQGWWWVPHAEGSAADARRRLRIVAQCKAEKKKLGPNYVREMEGVLHRYVLTSPHGREALPEHRGNENLSIPRPAAVALIVSESPFTKATLLRAQSSSLPFLMLYFPSLLESYEGQPIQQPELGASIGAAFWNQALSGTDGLLGGHMDIRWEHNGAGHGYRLGLWWKGKRLKSFAGPQSDDTDTLG